MTRRHAKIIKIVESEVNRGLRKQTGLKGKLVNIEIPCLSSGKDASTVKASQRTKTFQAFLDSLKTPHRKVVKLSLDYATRR